MAKLVDLGPVAILPGLINAHTHLEFGYLQQPLGRPGMSLVDWIRLVIAERGRRDFVPDSMRGWLESRASGVAMIGNIATTTDLFPVDILHFHEVIGFSRARADSAKQSLIERIDLTRGKIRGDKYGISPHAPYTVSPTLLKDLVSLAREHNVPMAMHLAESREELELLRGGTGPFQELLEERSMWDADAIPRGSRPLDYLRMLAESPRALIVHGNYLDEEELSYLAAQRERMSLVYCPRTHDYFLHSPYPLARALALGVRVALGTDSRASNPDLCLFDELRHTARAQSDGRSPAGTANGNTGRCRGARVPPTNRQHHPRQRE